MSKRELTWEEVKANLELTKEEEEEIRIEEEIIETNIATEKEKLMEEKIEKKLLKAEEQIEEGKTVKATEVLGVLKEKYGF